MLRVETQQTQLAAQQALTHIDVGKVVMATVSVFFCDGIRMLMFMSTAFPLSCLVQCFVSFPRFRFFW